MNSFLYSERVNNTSGFTYINWAQLVELCSKPLESTYSNKDTAKINSACIAAHDGKNKTKTDTVKHNNFTMLRLDLDEVNYGIDKVESELLALSIASYIIHTTAKHQQGEHGNRYRVYIELAHGLKIDDWSLLQTHLSEVFEADNCATRPQQIMFLPTHFDGIKFESRIGTGEAYTLSKTNELYQAALSTQVSLTADLEVIQEEYSTVKVAPTKKEKLVGNQISVINRINEIFSWDMLLTTYGFKKLGNYWHSPNQTDKTQTSFVAAGVLLVSPKDGRERFYSHSASDQAIFGNKCIDKFDFIRITEYGGDTKSAVKDLADCYCSEITKHNQIEDAIMKANELVLAALGAES